ncbi:MAG: MBL fold metallo-hydrolase [Hyphomicrobiaceae bacterium]
MTKTPPKQIAPIYRRRIGDITVTAVSDGTLTRTHEMMIGVSAEDGARHLQAAFRDAFVLSVNAFLVHLKDRLVLIETGSGDYLGPEAGNLLANLAKAGIRPDAIDCILLTHMHPDHSAGLTDLETGRPHYPNAELVCHENEPRHWLQDDAAMARATEREKKLMFQQARDQVAPYRDRLKTFSREGEILPGITAVPLPGHTPGHTGYLISSGGENLLVWGDTVHMPEVQVPRPEVAMVVDTDPEAARTMRKRTFERVAAERLLVTGMHLHFPGFAHIARDGDGFRLVPEPWQQSL